MHILMLSHGYAPTISGVTVVAQKLARAMVNRGHKVTVVAGSDRYRPYRHNDRGVEVVRVRSIANPFWKEGPLPILRSQGLRELVATVKPDIIHTHDSGLLTWPLFGIEQDCDLPHLLTCHYVPRFITNYIELGSRIDKLAELLAWKYTIQMVNHFDRVVFPTRTHEQNFLQHGLLRPSSVISNGIDIDRYRPEELSDPNLQDRYSLPARPRILFVGRMAKDKRLDLLIRAMPQVWRAAQGQLILVGRGGEQAALRLLARELGVDHAVHFLGFVPEQDLPVLYRQSDLFAIASECEVQSIPTIQAAASGLPIVGVRAGALPELIESERNGFLIPPGDVEHFGEALVRILSDRQRARSMGSASLAIGRRHSESLTLDAYEALYRQVLSDDDLILNPERAEQDLVPSLAPSAG
jgi:glycosyltransferase involved in cell wall biosynthesis